MNPDRFPHQHEFNLLGGFHTKEGIEYANKFRDELTEEYLFQMRLCVERADNLGGAKKIHTYGNKQE